MSKLAHSTILPKKEADVFKKVMTMYDKKEYRKSVKFAGE